MGEELTDQQAEGVPELDVWEHGWIARTTIGR
jgi:hypothetical protein